MNARKSGTAQERLVVSPSTLTAHREPSGQIVSIDQLDKNPNGWLRRHGVFSRVDALPVVLMLDRSEHNPAGSGTVALLHDDSRPLERIEQAIAALKLAAEALVAAGHEDPAPRAEQ